MTQTNGTTNTKCAEEYTVKRGDSFYLISHKLGVPLRDLLAANRDIHPARLMVGDVLCIPREEDDTPQDPAQRPTGDLSTGTEQQPVGDGTTGGTAEEPDCPLADQYIVQRGQSVADIQLRALLSRHTLDVANPDVDLESLRVGQTICVPQTNTVCALPRTYVIGASENLEGVASRFSLPVASLLRANPCLAPQDFEPGVTISLPQS